MATGRGGTEGRCEKGGTRGVARCRRACLLKPAVLEEAEAAHDAVDDVEHTPRCGQGDVRGDERHRPHLQRLLGAVVLMDLHVMRLLADGGDAPCGQELLAAAHRYAGRGGVRA